VVHVRRSEGYGLVDVRRNGLRCQKAAATLVEQDLNRLIALRQGDIGTSITIQIGHGQIAIQLVAGGVTHGSPKSGLASIEQHADGVAGEIARNEVRAPIPIQSQRVRFEADRSLRRT
jgi:hypothetical protein